MGDHMEMNGGGNNNGANKLPTPQAPLAVLEPSSKRSTLIAPLLKDLPDELFPRVLQFLMNYPSKGTRMIYLRELKEFAHHLASNPPRLEGGVIRSVRDITRGDIMVYARSCEARGLAPATTNRKLATLSAYFQFLGGELGQDNKPILERNLFYGVRRPRRETLKQTICPSDEQVEKLFALIPKDTPTGIFHRALFATMFGTGLRNDAIRNIRVGDFGIEQGVRVVRVKSKGEKVQIKAIADWVWGAIDSHLRQLRAAGVMLNDPSYVFQPYPKNARGRVGAPITLQSLSEALKRYFSELGITDTAAFRVSSHLSRVKFINAVAKSSGLERAQAEADHAKLSTTEIYLRRDFSVIDSPALSLSYAPNEKDSSINKG